MKNERCKNFKHYSKYSIYNSAVIDIIFFILNVSHCSTADYAPGMVRFSRHNQDQNNFLRELTDVCPSCEDGLNCPVSVETILCNDICEYPNLCIARCAGQAVINCELGIFNLFPTDKPTLPPTRFPTTTPTKSPASLSPTLYFGPRVTQLPTSLPVKQVFYTQEDYVENIRMDVHNVTLDELENDIINAKKYFEGVIDSYIKEYYATNVGFGIFDMDMDTRIKEVKSNTNALKSEDTNNRHLQHLSGVAIIYDQQFSYTYLNDGNNALDVVIDPFSIQKERDTFVAQLSAESSIFSSVASIGAVYIYDNVETDIEDVTKENDGTENSNANVEPSSLVQWASIALSALVALIAIVATIVCRKKSKQYKDNADQKFGDSTEPGSTAIPRASPANDASESYSHVILEAQLVPNSVRESQMQCSSSVISSISNDRTITFGPPSHGREIDQRHVTIPTSREDNNGHTPGAHAVDPFGGENEEARRVKISSFARTDNGPVTIPTSREDNNEHTPGAHAIYPFGEESEEARRVKTSSYEKDCFARTDNASMSEEAGIVLQSQDGLIPADDPFDDTSDMEDMILRKKKAYDSVRKHQNEHFEKIDEEDDENVGEDGSKSSF